METPAPAATPAEMRAIEWQGVPGVSSSLALRLEPLFTHSHSGWQWEHTEPACLCILISSHGAATSCSPRIPPWTSESAHGPSRHRRPQKTRPRQKYCRPLDPAKPHKKPI